VKKVLSTTLYAEQVFNGHTNRKRVTKRSVGEHVDRKGSDKNIFSGCCLGLHRCSSAVLQ
jgi:hypothetical protein